MPDIPVLNFGSDNMAGASPRVLDALVEANAGPAPSYGADPWTREAERLLADVFEHELTAFFVTSGTAANSLALSTLAQPWNAVLCHPHAHIIEDECSGPEFFTGGARLIPVERSDAKLAVKSRPRNYDLLWIEYYDAIFHTTCGR